MIWFIGKLRVPLLVLCLILFQNACSSNGGPVPGVGGTGPVAEIPNPTPEEPSPGEEEPPTLPELNACTKYDRVAKRNRSDFFKPTPRIIGLEVSKIVGVSTAAIGGWPWAAAIAFEAQDGSLNQFCGGSLIAEN